MQSLLLAPFPEAAEVRTSDHWLHTPVAWIRFHITARRDLFVPDDTGLDHSDVGQLRMTVFFRTSSDDWNGKVHTDVWRTDDRTEPPLSPHWAGLTVFQRAELEITVEQETHDKAAREAKALHRA